MPWAKARLGELLSNLTLVDGSSGAKVHTTGLESFTGRRVRVCFRRVLLAAAGCGCLNNGDCIPVIDRACVPLCHAETRMLSISLTHSQTTSTSTFTHQHR